MKSVVNKADKKVNSGYPCLKESHFGIVVLFLEKNSGVIVNSTNINYLVGHNIDDWDMDDFTDLNGTVTLSND